MPEKRFILVLDQGTTSSRALLIDRQGRVRAMAHKALEQIYPHPGWVEHDPLEIWSSQYQVAGEVMAKIAVDGHDIAGIGLTNQRETTIVWERYSGKPLSNAIVWQDRRTAGYCNELKKNGLIEPLREKTGLLPDAYFSATKIQWILNHIVGAREKAENGRLAFGTVDAWLIWQLTGGRIHATDATNASRTLLFNLHTLSWDDDLLNIFNIPRSMLPEVKSCSEIYGETVPDLFGAPIPICGVAGDQQAAMFGQMCTRKGMIKNTYGTGCFIMMNTGDKPIVSKNNLLSTLAWVYDKGPTFALEGSIFIAGAVVQWLRDGLGIIREAEEIEQLAEKVVDNGGVYMVPAFTGLGAPHWDPYARGTIIGITRGTTKGHIARAALESIAYQTKDVLDAMVTDSRIPARELRVDGGASANRLLMQFQSDILGIKVMRPKILETTAMGAGFFAGLAVGFWPDTEALCNLWQEDVKFMPSGDEPLIRAGLSQWSAAVSRSRGWHQ